MISREDSSFLMAGAIEILRLIGEEEAANSMERMASAIRAGECKQCIDEAICDLLSVLKRRNLHDVAKDLETQLENARLGIFPTDKEVREAKRYIRALTSPKVLN